MINSKGRITSIDALRGVVLFGILLVHASAFFCFSLPDVFSFSQIDLFLKEIVEFFLNGRCRIIFSFLFGVSFYLILKNPNYSSKKFIWRCFLLFLIGLIVKFVYTHNILMWYGLMGIILVGFRKQKTSHLLLFSSVIFISF